MTQPIIRHNVVCIREGERLDFFVGNKATLQDGKDYFVLQDPNGTKHFIEADPYTNYGISPGMTLQCTVAKINCTGRIILEPQHPVYKVGQKYLFKVQRIEKESDRARLTLKDHFGNEISLVISDEIPPEEFCSKRVYCRIIAIRKGIPEVVIQAD